MGHDLRGGKLAPRFIQDLKNYDPQRLDQGTFDALSEVPFHDFSEQDEHPPLPAVSCQHRWTKKVPQSGADEHQLASQKKQCLRSFCLRCRCHLEVEIDHFEGASNARPCPNVDRPLHHLVYEAPTSPTHQPSDGHRLGPWSLRVFRCSAPSCGLTVGVKYGPPRLKHAWVSLLTDERIIRERAEKAIANDPEKFQGHAPPTPGNVLETLCRLVNKASVQTDIRPIPRDGKGFLLNLGDQCTEIMEFLGFKADTDFWQFPRLDKPVSTPSDDPNLKLLDDVKQEISALMLSRPDYERRTLKFSFSPVSALNDLNHGLDCETYKHRVENVKFDPEAVEHPSYDGIGTIANLHDELIVFAYERQIAVDHANLPYYLECLQVIAEGRGSEDLSTKVAIEASDGRISLKDIRNAYQSLGVTYRNNALTDITIIGNFKARLGDSPRQEGELRQSLNTIGLHRGSSKLQSAAAKTVDDYEEAIAFLDATIDTPDPFIVSCYAVKVDANQGDEATARRAVALVANHRKSKALRQWLETGVLGDVEMDIGQAYARLNIQDRNMDDETIITVYKIGAEEQPSQLYELRRALATIAKDRSSLSLSAYAGLETVEEDHPLAEWPVALNNIGNTCYLNSLLQFYFSIRPLRDLVLNIDDFKSPLNNDEVKSRKIGGRNCSRKEIERAQRTAEELRKLFNDLITSSLRSVRPNTELARLTLLTPKAENARRQSIRQSMNHDQRPTFITTGENTVQAEDGQALLQDRSEGGSVDPLPRSTPHISVDEKEVARIRANNSSSETLVDDVANFNDSMALDPDSDPSKVVTVASKDIAKPSNSTNPMAEDSRYSNGLTPEGLIINDAFVENEKTPSQPPTSQPPPIPPRPKTEIEPEEAVKEAEFAAQQQDVNEIAYNILNQLQCAIRPISLDQEGEQIDQIKHLFYGKQKTYITNQSGQVRTKDEYMSDIKVSVHGDPHDIYAALDGAFDVEDVAVAGGIEPKYSTISHLPPVLQIHIQRGQYDSENKKQFKSTAHIALQNLIYLDRYMDTNDEDVLRQREESWVWKRQLADLRFRRNQLIKTEVDMAIPAAIDCACEYLRQLQGMEESPQLEVPDGLIEGLEKAAQEAQDAINDIEHSIGQLEKRISRQFETLKQIPYRLAAVFMHRGSTNAGHYWIYIFDFEKSLWRSYNDERVTRVQDAGEIFHPPDGDRPATPYFLVYVKDDIKESLVNPVCRDIDITSESPKDTAMEEYEQIELDDFTPTTQNGWDDQMATGGGW